MTGRAAAFAFVAATVFLLAWCAIGFVDHQLAAVTFGGAR